MNIDLRRDPRIEDYDYAVVLSEDDCICTGEMKRNLEQGGETICRPCAARQVLNGLTTLRDQDEA